MIDRLVESKYKVGVSFIDHSLKIDKIARDTQSTVRAPVLITIVKSIAFCVEVTAQAL